jgi:four helix bundle protein
MSVQSYRDLAAWQKAMDLVEAVYRATQHWPRDEMYGLTNQARRAAVSVPANIAEGQGRRGPTEMLHHLSIADGSLHELETHLLIAQRLRYLEQRLRYLEGATATILLAQTAEVGRILGGLMRGMREPGDRR